MSSSAHIDNKKKNSFWKRANTRYRTYANYRKNVYH